MKTRSHVTGAPSEMPRPASPSIAVRVMITAAVLVVLTGLALPALAEEEKQALENETGFYYTVKKGDTLWDLSERFADSPWTWPELWKENDQIPNPHQIYPGERIRLYHQDWIDRVSKQVPKPVETAPPPEPEPEKPAPAVAPEAPKPEFLYRPIDAVGFIRKTPAKSLGSIFKVQQPKAFFGAGDIVYIRYDDQEDLVANKLYTVYRTLDPVRNPETKEIYGIQHLLVGTVRITSLEPRYAIGVVERSYRAMYLGDKLIPFDARAPTIPLTSAVPGLKGVLIGSEDETVLIGEYMTGFIDKGKKDGVRPGQEYLLYYQESDKVNLLDKDPIVLAPINFGTLLVLHAEEEAATVLITDSRGNIPPGTLFRAPGQ